MHKLRIVWILAAAVCIAIGGLLLALRFSNPYILSLRSASVPLLGVSALTLMGLAVIAAGNRHRAIAIVLGAISVIIATGATISLPGIVAFLLAIVLTVIAVSRIAPYGLGAKR
jgi:hypothetical protein